MVRQKPPKELLRIVDANFNRAKEALRVCEDVCRFFLNKSSSTRQYKELRHELTDAVAGLGLSGIIAARDIESDVGRQSTASEFRRRDVKDIFYANSQRAKESLRVLEEFSKMISPRTAEDLKKLRYRSYSLEQKILKAL